MPDVDARADATADTAADAAGGVARPSSGYGFAVPLSPAVRPVASTGSQVLEALGAGVARAASVVRGERVIHAEGTTLHGRLVVPENNGLGVPLLDAPATWRALVRLSRGAGLPDRVPDVLGIAVRVLDAHGPGRHQDLLLSSSVTAPLLRRVPVPRLDLLGATYSSIAPYRLGTAQGVLLLLPEDDAPPTRSPHHLPGRGDGARFRLALSGTRGAARGLAVLELGGTAQGGRQIRFSPDVTGGGIAPVGWLQDLRRRAYRASHVGPDA